MLPERKGVEIVEASDCSDDIHMPDVQRCFRHRGYYADGRA